MQLSSAVITAILALTCAAAPHPRSAWVQHEKRDATSHQWQRRDRAVPGHVIPINIALRERNIENTARYVEEVSDPKSPNFGMSLDAKTCHFMLTVLFQANTGVQRRSPMYSQLMMIRRKLFYSGLKSPALTGHG